MNTRELLLIGFMLNEGRGHELGAKIPPEGISDPMLRRVFKELANGGPGEAVKQLKKDLLIHDEGTLVNGLIEQCRREGRRALEFKQHLLDTLGREK